MMDHDFSLEQHFKRHPRLTLSSHKDIIHAVRWSPDGNYLASGGKDKSLNLHMVTEAGEIVTEQRYATAGHTNDIDQICWDPDGPSLLSTASIDGCAKVWDVKFVEPIASIRLKNQNTTICWSNNGSTIAVADRADFIFFIDTRSGFRVFKEQKFPFEVSEIGWNNSDDLFFITSGDGRIHVLSYPDLKSLLVIDAFSSACVCMRFDPTGKHLAVGSHDAITSIWDVENLACVHAIDRLDWPVKTVSFSFDGKYLASGSEDNFIDFADVQTGRQVGGIEVPKPTLTLDFHPREYILAYALHESEYRDIGALKIVGFPERKEERRRNHN